MSKKALIAMSGGVDSSVAAYLMKKEGYECIGATMHLYDNEDIGISREKTCCSLSDVEDARAVATKLGMPFYVFNFKEDFKSKVIDRFVSEYAAGRTPNPCIDCNRFMKFERFHRRGLELGCDVIVTGHYAVTEKDEKTGRFLLKKGADRTKDQSYVLYSMTQEVLAETAFPLGKLDKQTVRKIAEENGFVNAQKRDSQDICFVPDGDHGAAIERFSGKTFEKGEFIGPDGEVLGEHKGLIHYTIGQRRGLGLSLKESLYVHHFDTETNRIYLSRNEDLFSMELLADEVNWISVSPEEIEDKGKNGIRCNAKIRYSQKETPATVYTEENGRIRLVFDEPVRAVTKGQAVVMYNGDIVMGGGVIV